MTGNVWEWLQDTWHANNHGAPDNSSAWEIGGNDSRRVLRGGSWSFETNYVRSASRGEADAGYRYFNLGVRLAQD